MNIGSITKLEDATDIQSMRQLTWDSPDSDLSRESALCEDILNSTANWNDLANLEDWMDIKETVICSVGIFWILQPIEIMTLQT